MPVGWRRPGGGLFSAGKFIAEFGKKPAKGGDGYGVAQKMAAQENVQAQAAETAEGQSPQEHQ
jgi:hypothetical protein